MCHAHRELRRTVLAAGPMVLLAVVLIAGCPQKPQESTPPAQPTTGPGATSAGPAKAAPSGSATVIQAKGSDTLLQVAQALAEEYRKQHPELEVSVSGGGTGTGFQALIEGTTDIADASRKITDEETQAAKAKGIEPVEHLVGYDGIAVIVNKANPIKQITIDQLSDLFVGQTKDWKALGGTGEVVLVSRDSTSGTYAYFKENVVQKGDKKSTRDYAATAVMVPSNTQVRDQVAQTKTAIGYIGLGYLDTSVKAVPIVDKAGKAVLPSIATVRDNTYPISRPLFMYTKQDITPAIQAYLDWIVGPEGQKLVEKEGFVPLSK